MIPCPAMPMIAAPNAVPITEWRIRFRHTHQWYGSLKDTITLDFHLRCDVHGLRVLPHQAPTLVAVLLPSAQDSGAQWQSGGGGNVGVHQYTWSGSGSIPHFDFWASPLLPLGVTASATMDLPKRIMRVSPTAQSGLNKTETVTWNDGTGSYSAMDFVEVLVGPVDIQLDSSFGVPAGSAQRDISDGEVAILEWDAAPAKFPPVAGVTPVQVPPFRGPGWGQTLWARIWERLAG